MVRSILCAAALLSLGSAAQAVPINITDISGTWIAQTDSLELRFDFDRPPVLTNDFINFLGYTSLTQHPHEIMSIQTAAPPADAMRARSVYVYMTCNCAGGEEIEQPLSPWHTVDHVIDGNSLAVMLSVPELNLMGNELYVRAFTAEWSDLGTHGVRVESYVLLHAPEPSSVAMAAIGVVGVLGHCLFRRRPRARGGAGLGSGRDHCG